MTSEEWYNRLAARCSVAEMCISDVRKKLESSGLTTGECEAVVRRLVEGRFVDEERYARAFVREKFRFSGWGRVKIAQGLRQKLIDRHVVDEALLEIDDDEYLQALRCLLQDKRRTVKGRSAYEVNGKLIRFALGRGFEMPLILSELHADEGDYV